MRNFILLLFVFVFNIVFTSTIHASNQENDWKRKVCGTVYDESTREKLKKASILVTNSKKEKKTTSTNDEGYFCAQLSGPSIQVKISYLGYVDKTIMLSNLSSDTTLTILLEEKSEALDEVVVTGNNKARDFVETPQMGMLKFSQKEIKNIPTLFGEADIIKALQTQPGVSAGTEGLAGMYVRGGNNDENLYLINGNPLYQVNHLGGLFSAFNTEAIESVDFYKSAFPAHYGGRLSSVMDVHTKTGNMQEYHGSIMLGLISGNVSIEGPIVKNKTSFVASIRRSWLDLLSIPTLAILNKRQKEEGKETMAKYAFADLNLRIDHILDEQNKMYFDLYSGTDGLEFGAKNFSTGNPDDYYESEDRNDLNWGNRLFSMGWNHQFNPLLKLNLNASFSRYKSATELNSTYTTGSNEERTREKEYNKTTENGIDDVGVRTNFDYTLGNNHRLNFGLDLVHHRFLPENTRLFTLIDSIPEERILKSKTYGNELGVYLEDDWKVSSSLQLKGGLRLNTFNSEGKSHVSLEPRISSRLLISPMVSFKASYARMSQCVQQLNESYINLPTDPWMPLGKNFKPLMSDQLSTGLFFNFREKYSLGVESYYKWMNNLIDYKDGYNYLSYSTTWEEKLTSGRGQSYGLELIANKYVGRLTGYVGYGLMWSNRQFAEINNGLTFPSKYDNRHKINIVGNWKQSKKLEFNMSWTYSTGNRMTLSLENYPDMSPSGFPSTLAPTYPYQNEWGVDYYSTKNNVRLPAYHRLDIGVNIYVPKKNGKMGIWNISIYNAYCRINPIVIQKGIEHSDDLTTHSPQFQALGIVPFIPSVSYTYKF